MRRNVRVTKTSRALLRVNLFFQNARLFFGLVSCFGQPCQKQPSTKIASLSFEKMKSGLPKIFLFRRHPVILFRRNSFASAISVSLFPRERMRDITSERFVLVKMSDIFKSVDLPNLAVKAQPGIEMANDWTREEVEAAVADYFDMLEKEISGIPYSKIDHNRRLQKILVNRSKGSIEFKHQNITAVLIENEFANIPGYKPRFNYQDLLRIVVEDRLVRAKKLQEAAKIAVAKPVD
jgi:hypothetical protein